jgi:hypothetical protein
MGYQIPDNDQERLELLNESLIKLICSEDYFDDEKWVMVRLNLDKWKRMGYSLKFEKIKLNNTFKEDEIIFLLRVYNLISEVLLFQYGIKECVKTQNFEQAALYRDLGKVYRKVLADKLKNAPANICLFDLKGHKLVMKFVENYFVNQHLMDRFRLS